MAISERFLSDAKIGASVSVLIGAKEITGVISSLDVSTVQIQKEDGNISTVSIDSISFYEFINSPASTNLTTDYKLKINSRSELAFKKLEERGDSFFSRVQCPSIKDYSEIANNSVTNVKEQLKSISNSLKTAINQNHEHNPDDYKIKENIAKLKKIIGQPGNITKKEAANMLGALYHQLQSDRMSLTAYLDGNDYVSAFLVARNMNSEEYMEIFAGCHFIEGSVYDHFVIKWLTDHMIKKNDYSILRLLKPASLSDDSLVGALAVTKTIMLANSINYDSSIDKDNSVASLVLLINQIDAHRLSKQIELKKSLEKHYNRITNFQMAQHAELVEKDFQKAIKYYKEAIKQSECLTISIPKVINLLNGMKMYKEAFEILETKGRSNLEYSKYLDLKISVLSDAKNPKHKHMIKDTYIEAVVQANSREKRTELMLDEAYLLFSIGEFNEAINIYNLCLEKINNSPYYEDHPERKEKRLTATYQGLCKAYQGLCKVYIKQNDLDAAKKYAQEIIKISPEDEFAISLIRGEDNGGFITSGVSGISRYIMQRIDNIDLQSELRNTTLIKEGVYIGDSEKAIKIIDAIKGDQVKNSVNDEVKSNYYFAIAKLIRQIIDRDNDKLLSAKKSSRINERMYQLYAAIGIFFYGNYRILRSESAHKGIDPARYCLFEAFAMFNDSETLHACWAAATVRYIQTFYSSESSMKANRTRLYSKFEDNGFDDYEQLIKEIMQNRLYVPIDDFVIGMIEMITFNSRIRVLILNTIFNKPEFRLEVEKVLNSLIGDEDSISDNEEQFFEKWNQASKRYSIERKDYLRLISDTIKSVFVVGELQDNCERLNDDKFFCYLNSTDKDSVEKLKSIFAWLLRYNEISEFDYKADTLGRANEICNRLEEKILDNPTYFGYEKILPLIKQLQSRILEESTLLYGNSEPVISVEISGDCSVDNENVVLVPIAFTNKNNVQNADNVSISIDGDSVRVINDEQLSRIMLPGNGVALEELVEFKVDANVLNDQVFSVNIKIQYQYKTSMTETQVVQMEAPLSVPLYSNSTFKPIDNKFEPYRNGSEVKEPSMFYGRNKEIQSIIEQISDAGGNVLRGRCLALYGQTRTGKSSLLYHLERKLRDINEERNIIVNIGSIGEENLSGNDITEFLYTILDELDHEISSKHPILKEICKEAELIIDAGLLLENPQRSQLYFNDVFKKLNRLMEDKNLNYNIIIMIDEFTYIYDWIRMGTMTDRIMKFWKAFIQNNGVFAIVIGQDHMMKFVEEKQFTNDFGSTDLRKVTYLPEDDAKKLMYEPILLVDDNGNTVNRYKEGALDRLYELTAGSAFLIMNLCAGLVDYLNKTHSVYITRAHIDDYLKKNLATFEEARFFEPQYDDKSNVNNDAVNVENKMILRRIAQLSNKKEWTSLSSVITNEHDRDLLKSLEQRDVIIVSNNERCKIKVGLYKEWIIEKYGVEGQK